MLFKIVRHIPDTYSKKPHPEELTPRDLQEELNNLTAHDREMAYGIITWEGTWRHMVSLIMESTCNTGRRLNGEQLTEKNGSGSVKSINFMKTTKSRRLDRSWKVASEATTMACKET